MKPRPEIQKLNDAAMEMFLIVKRQAEDDGLWFMARTAPEAYLQQELRRLHDAVEEMAGAVRAAMPKA